MKDIVQTLLDQAAAELGITVPTGARIEPTRDPAHGDLAANLALVAAKAAGRSPRELAQALVEALPADAAVRKVEIAGPGFINFFLASENFHALIEEILRQGEAFGCAPSGSGQRVLVEFVSANPTGPLHVGHGRGAAYGDCLVRLLRAAGDRVEAEYYVNDAGRQMDILALSVWLRYLESHGPAPAFPSRAYQGQYIRESAARLSAHAGDTYLRTPSLVDVPADDAEHGDAHLDGLIRAAKEALGPDGFAAVLQHVLDEQLAEISQDLSAFRVEYDHWASERDVVDRGEVRLALARLAEHGSTYEQDGALWFASSRYGDDKDRVLLRANGTATYFANDIAYHLDKLERGFDRLIDVWGADHHGYVKRMAAAVEALTGRADALDVQLVQFVSLLRDGEKVSMSTRAGTYETLADLRAEVGVDAARYFYVMRGNDQHLEFDLALATQKSNDNPVYYVQYAHARIVSVFRQLADKGLAFERATALSHLPRLTEPAEHALQKTLARYPDTVRSAARQLAPQIVVHYLRELAEEYHRYYNSAVFLGDDAALRDARLLLNLAVQQVLANGLGLLGVSAPDQM